MLNPVLTSQDCMACKLCCKFEPDEIVDAPLFTEEIRDLVLTLIDANIKFVRKGEMWQIQLEEIPGQNKFICPILDPNKGCRLGEDRPFDCKTWPFYIMDFKWQIVITVSPSCPVVNAHALSKLRDFIQQGLSDFMLDAARTNPDLLSEYHDQATILSVLWSKEDLLIK